MTTPPPSTSALPKSEDSAVLDSLTVQNQDILKFFKQNCINPEQFILNAIDNFTVVSRQPEAKFESKPFRNEYSQYLNKKESLLFMAKEQIKMIESMKFDYLDAVFCQNVGITRETAVCQNCNGTFKNKKSLSVHQRRCNGSIGVDEHENESDT